MALSQSDQNDLVLPLFEGLFEVPLWSRFLRNLALRTGAARARLAVGRVLAPDVALYSNRSVAGREPLQGTDDISENSLLALLPLGGLRANRVYALDELRDYDRPERRLAQDAALKAAAVGDLRHMRVSGNERYWLSLTLLADSQTFVAADSALLSNLVPALEAALRSLFRVRQSQMRADCAETSLALLGIGQAVLDINGQPIAADDLWRESYAGAPGALANAATAAANSSRTTTVGDTVLIRPWRTSESDGPDQPAAIASLRIAKRSLGRQAPGIVAASMGLSEREAALAVLLCQGVSLSEAGRSLNLTEETTRNYSKRIYAKTGTKGQADLVGAVLSGLAPLA